MINLKQLINLVIKNREKIFSLKIELIDLILENLISIC